MRSQNIGPRRLLTNRHFKVNLLCRLDGSCGPAAAAPRRRLPVSSGKFGPGRFSDAKGQAASSQPLRYGPDCRQCGVVAVDLNFPQGKLTEVKTMLTVDFTGQVLAFKGPVLVEPIITRLNFQFFENFKIFFLIYFNFKFYLKFIHSLCYSFILLPITAYYCM